LDDYQSYNELLTKKFTIPKMRDLGLILSIKSDFLLNNVNFALSNLNNNRIMHSIRKENIVKLVTD